MGKMDFYTSSENRECFKIPILPVTQMVIDKYENHPQCVGEDKLLPILSNQK